MTMNIELGQILAQRHKASLEYLASLNDPRVNLAVSDITTMYEFLHNSLNEQIDNKRKPETQPRRRKRSRNVPTIYAMDRWTDTDRDLLVKLYQDGQSYTQIAKQLGRSYCSVKSQKNKLIRPSNGI